jgi:hypothetical protein
MPVYALSAGSRILEMEAIEVAAIQIRPWGVSELGPFFPQQQT